jgi:hypothetical protein
MHTAVLPLAAAYYGPPTASLIGGLRRSNRGYANTRHVVPTSFSVVASVSTRGTIRPLATQCAATKFRTAWLNLSGCW